MGNSKAHGKFLNRDRGLLRLYSFSSIRDDASEKTRVPSEITDPGLTLALVKDPCRQRGQSGS